MRAFEISPDNDPGGADGHRPRSPLRLAGQILAGLAIVASFGVWGYAYSGLADRETPDQLSDRSLAETGERICSAALSDVAAMPSALDARDERERADGIRLATGRLEAMVAELGALEVLDERDEQIFTAWLSDWAVILGDRLTYAEAIETDPGAQFLLSDTGVNERLDRRISRFATTNQMPSCAAPTDV